MTKSPINSLQPDEQAQPQQQVDQAPQPSTPLDQPKTQVKPESIYPEAQKESHIKEQPTHDPTSVYPIPGSQVDSADKDDRLKYSSVPPVSAAILSTLLLLYGIYAAITLMRLLVGGVVLGLWGLDVSLIGGAYQWLGVILNIGFIAAIFGSSWGIWHRNKVALAFVAGLSFFMIRIMLLLIVTGLERVGSLSFQESMLLIGYVAFIVSQVLCWTKDRKYFY